MKAVLTPARQRDLAERGFSRRSFGRIAAMLSAGAALPFYNEPALAQRAGSRQPLPPGAVKLDSNENPMGPCPEALAAAHAMVQQGGRYFFEQPDMLRDAMAESEGLKPNYVRIFAGSSAALHQGVLGFCSPDHAFVIGDPGYEAGESAARLIGAKAIRVPLTKDYAHDVKAMASADANAGLIYVCNPNNPTGTLTSHEDIEWLLANKPAGSVVMIDEAYIHLCDTPMCSSLVAQDKDLIILRTFSKIYGMAGLRAGAAFARPDLLQKVTRWSSNFMPTTGMAAATVSIKSKTLVPERRKAIADIRNDLQAFLDKHNIGYIPSISNKIMIDTGRPGGEIVQALRQQNVYVGRVWSSLPNHIRVTIGTQDEMNKFKAAFLQVMA